jgi:hypothetical protein
LSRRKSAARDAFSRIVILSEVRRQPNEVESLP